MHRNYRNTINEVKISCILSMLELHDMATVGCPPMYYGLACRRAEYQGRTNHSPRLSEVNGLFAFAVAGML